MKPKFAVLLVCAVTAFGVVGAPLAAQASPKLDSTWTVSVNGQSIQVNADGSFQIPNVSAADEFGSAGPGSTPDFVSDDYLRVLGVSTAGGVTRYAFSDLFRITRGQILSVGQMTITDSPPSFPQSLRSSVDDALLTTAGQTTRVRVMGTFLDGSISDVSASVKGTTYRSSNPNILSVDSEGLATATGDGLAFVTATNSRAATVSSVMVEAFDPTQVIGFVQANDGSLLAGAKVVVQGQGLEAISDANGRFVIDDVSTSMGNLQLRASFNVRGSPLVGCSETLTPVIGGFTDAGFIVLDRVTLGMVTCEDGDGVLVFEADRNTVLGFVPFPPPTPDGSQKGGDCSISPDGTLGFVTNSTSQVWVIDLVPDPPVLAAGQNPIAISNKGGDTTITADGKYLLVTPSSVAGVVSVVDIANRQEVSTNGSFGINTIEACSDGSIMATQASLRVRRMTLDAAGNLTDHQDEYRHTSLFRNVICTGDFGASIAIGSISIVSFVGPGLTKVDTRSPGYRAGVFTPNGDLALLRQGGTTDAFAFDPVTGSLGTEPVFSSIHGLAQSLLEGLETIAMHPDGTRAYVAAFREVVIISTVDGSQLGVITDPAFDECGVAGVTVR